MSRYLALFIGAADPKEKASVPDDVSQRFMEAWGEWHAAHADAIVEPGSPLGANTRVVRDGAAAVANQLVGWMIVEAGSADAAAAMFARHPHGCCRFEADAMSSSLVAQPARSSKLSTTAPPVA